jgi:hypothetical protein
MQECNAIAVHESTTPTKMKALECLEFQRIAEAGIEVEEEEEEEEEEHSHSRNSPCGRASPISFLH